MSKSGTLTYQMMYELRDFGFSTAIGIGGDPIIGTTHIDALEAFEDDPETKAIVMIGEIGGDAEERAAAYIKDHVTKPVVGYVAGFTAPEGKTMGHAGAIVSGSSGTAQAKKEALEAVGVKVGKTPSETAELMREILQEPLRPRSTPTVPPPHLLVLPSPFLGPAPYEPVAAALSSRGYARVGGPPRPTSPVAADLVASWERSAAGLGDVGAGAPQQRRLPRAGGRARAAGAPVVFVDAALPPVPAHDPARATGLP